MNNENTTETVARFNATLVKKGNMFIMEFFNSKEVYDIKLFETERKAKNYAKKWDVKIHDSRPNTEDYTRWE